ncbi:hypothetical protein B0H13DRAFT_2383039 [Mycena leptocephala]|nr:hypothetical protein B0H13DRAFT_2383039 [Mycena leptocephala]
MSPPMNEGGNPPKTPLAAAADADAADGEPEESAPKRKRGRPPKTPLAVAADAEQPAADGDPEEPAPKRKRGRPPKTPLAVAADAEQPHANGEPEEPAPKRSRGPNGELIEDEGRAEAAESGDGPRKKGFVVPNPFIIANFVCPSRILSANDFMDREAELMEALADAEEDERPDDGAIDCSEDEYENRRLPSKM